MGVYEKYTARFHFPQKSTVRRVIRSFYKKEQTLYKLCTVSKCRLLFRIGPVYLRAQQPKLGLSFVSFLLLFR